MRIALALVVMMTGSAVADPQEDVMRCWSPPSSITASDGSVEVNVEIHFEVDTRGQLSRLPTSPQQTSSETEERVAAEAGIRAIRRCAPYDVPAGRYRVFFPEVPLTSV